MHSTTKLCCALLCAACDLPAGRKLCGFLIYTATYGCSCCLVVKLEARTIEDLTVIVGPRDQLHNTE